MTAPTCAGLIALALIVAVIWAAVAARGLERVIDDPYERKD